MSKLTAYTEQYKESCFQAWYAGGRPTLASKIFEILPYDEYDRQPSMDIMRKWRNEGEWDLRADEMDSKANRIVEDELIGQRVEMLKQQAKRARMMQEKGAEYLEDNGFDSSSSAVQAIVKGAEMERSSLGLSDAMLKLARLTNDELQEETRKMLENFVNSGESGDIIDVDEVEDDFDKE